MTAKYRVSFYGAHPSLLLPPSEPRVYARYCETRDEGEALFDSEPRAYQMERWEPEISGWLLLSIRDRQLFRLNF